jgi:hypothetical protein
LREFDSAAAPRGTNQCGCCSSRSRISSIEHLSGTAGSGDHAPRQSLSAYTASQNRILRPRSAPSRACSVYAAWFTLSKDRPGRLISIRSVKTVTGEQPDLAGETGVKPVAVEFHLVAPTTSLGRPVYTECKLRLNESRWLVERPTSPCDQGAATPNHDGVSIRPELLE